MSMFLIILIIYFVIGIIYTWKVTGYLGSYFKTKKSTHKQKGKDNFLKSLNPIYLIWISLEVILVLLWLPLLVKEKLSMDR
ncbi:hypothetical protein DS031_12885 [Bacillus taeanensis]|uniref:Uncharacterized protein n=1 Tax=Bacillus taeanensis TaxID=273032 RepID=A0A366XUL8_9BACI|nr:hypothetical protein DS031_12885 [Bacillus taeanensis]